MYVCMHVFIVEPNEANEVLIMNIIMLNQLRLILIILQGNYFNGRGLHAA